MRKEQRSCDGQGGGRSALFLMCSTHTFAKSSVSFIQRKKWLATFPSPEGMSLTRLSVDGKNLIIPVQREFGDISSEAGNVANLFLHSVAEKSSEVQILQ